MPYNEDYCLSVRQLMHYLATVHSVNFCVKTYIFLIIKDESLTKKIYI